MWNNIVPGIGETFYDFAFWLLAYSIMGWFVESVYMSYCNKKITNRGFVHGPICPIYGFGGIFVHTSLKVFAGNYVALFFFGMVLATTIEFVTAMLMIRLFGCVWWDYTNKPFNYKGILCLESCVVWGLYSVLDSAVFKDTVFIGIRMIPIHIGKILLVSVFIYYVLDFTYCAIKSHKGEITEEENNTLRFNN